MTIPKITITTSDHGATIDGQYVDWDTLRAAARQDDPVLAQAYSEILRRAERANEHRLVSLDWQAYGYPLKTGYNQRYQGQIVMRAWEIRRKQHGGQDTRVAYILAWDRSDNTIRIEQASPELPTVDACEEWLIKHYGGWHDEIGGERTAGIWFHA